MQIATLLRPQSVRSIAQVNSKKRLLQEIADMAQNVYGLPSALVADALQERETLAATGVGHGVALPHARLHGLEETVGLFIRLEKPLEFDAVDRLPVDLIFTLLAPSRSGVDHLKWLALVSRTMRNQALRERLRANPDPVKLHALLTGAEGL